MKLTNNEIMGAIKKSGAALSAKGIAHYAGIDDTPSEILQQIVDRCWELVNRGLLTAYDKREQKNGILAFSTVDE